MSKTNLVDTKSLLAKLLAAENITIRHLDVDTAYFDVQDRVLTCPIWKDMDGCLYDLLMGHEVGHALYTPVDGKKPEYGEKFCGFLNIVEDCRIEKLIKRKFPGIRKSFTQGYAEFLKRDLFGINRLNGDTSRLNLIDRINLYFKCGSHIVIKFSEEERVFVKRIEDVESFDKVLQITKDIWDYCKEHENQKINNKNDLQEAIKKLKEALKNGNVEIKKSNSQKNDETDENSEKLEIPGDATDGEESEDDSEEKSGGEKSDEESDVDGNGSDSEETDSDDDEDEDSDFSGKSSGGGDDGDDDEDEDDSEKDSSSSQVAGQEGAKSESDDPQSVTDQFFREREQQLIDQNAKAYVLMDLPDCNLERTIVPVKTLLKAFEGDVSKEIKDYNLYNINNSSQKIVSYEHLSNELFKTFHDKNVRYISLLVKEFEMRKNAKQYQRQLESKSGELDTRSLAKYRFSNDIFRKMTETPKGKSHGMIMFVDMSSSMTGIIRNTFEQTVVLALFCKKVGIPFRVYGYSDLGVTYDGVSYREVKFSSKSVMAFRLLDQDFHLKELINSDLSVRDFRRAAAMMITYAALYNGSYRGFSMGGHSGQMSLSGTPTIETLVASKQIINRFKQSTNVDIVNVIHLTDGCGNPSLTMPVYYNGMSIHDCNIGFVDPLTKKRVMVNAEGATYGTNVHQAAITKLIRESTDCRHIGFYIGTEESIDAMSTILSAGLDDKTKIRIKKSLKDDGYFMTPNLGYDSYYYVKVKSGAVKDENMKLGKRFTEGELFREFEKVQAKKHSNRALVSSFASEIAA
jgi:hypothetical protein